ncbi:MAG: type II toxin-antitoxin system RelE/ParE family toxin [Methylotenera sp.]|nr:type II toxin-antitoxin system RelE/ParE family toxin [Methylotenera sp.]
MTYKLRFHELALIEWKKLDNSIREPLKRKLIERLEFPHVTAARLLGMPNCYKIKLLHVGYRLIYQVEGDILFVTVLAVGKRDKLKVYNTAKSRL